MLLDVRDDLGLVVADLRPAAAGGHLERRGDLHGDAALACGGCGGLLLANFAAEHTLLQELRVCHPGLTDRMSGDLLSDHERVPLFGRQLRRDLDQLLHRRGGLGSRGGLLAGSFACSVVVGRGCFVLGFGVVRVILGFGFVLSCVFGFGVVGLVLRCLRGSGHSTLLDLLDRIGVLLAEFRRGHGLIGFLIFLDRGRELGLHGSVRPLDGFA